MAAGSQHQIVGVPLIMELRHRSPLIDLLDADPDAEDLAAWLGAAFAPPRMVNREGEDTVLCPAVLRPRTTTWGAEGLLSLLEEFEGHDDRAMVTFDVSRIKKRLGLLS